MLHWLLKSSTVSNTQATLITRRKSLPLVRSSTRRDPSYTIIDIPISKPLGNYQHREQNIFSRTSQRAKRRQWRCSRRRRSKWWITWTSWRNNTRNWERLLTRLWLRLTIRRLSSKIRNRPSRNSWRSLCISRNRKRRRGKESSRAKVLI